LDEELELLEKELEMLDDAEEGGGGHVAPSISTGPQSASQ